MSASVVAHAYVRVRQRPHALLATDALLRADVVQPERGEDVGLRPPSSPEIRQILRDKSSFDVHNSKCTFIEAAHTGRGSDYTNSKNKNKNKNKNKDKNKDKDNAHDNDNDNKYHIVAYIV